MPAPAWGTLVTTPQNESYAASLSLLLLPPVALMQMSPVGSFPRGTLFIYLFLNAILERTFVFFPVEIAFHGFGRPGH